MDGDWGGDEMQLAAVLINNQRKHPQSFEIVGATCTFGNSSLEIVVKNAAKILKFLGRPNMPIYEGAAVNGKGERLLGDDAHIEVPLAEVPDAPVIDKDEKDAVAFILETIRANPGEVIITATGPLTNIAEAIRREPETMAMVKEIVIMGGCVNPIPTHYDEYGSPIEGKTKKGNISPHAEFNFQQAPDDARAVMESCLPITLIPMDCTHQMTLTHANGDPEKDAEPFKDDDFLGQVDRYRNRQQYAGPRPRAEAPDMNRQQHLEELLSEFPEDRDAVIEMMRGPIALEAVKFQTYPVLHDVSTAYRVLELLGIQEPQYTYKHGLNGIAVETQDINRRNSLTTRNGKTTAGHAWNPNGNTATAHTSELNTVTIAEQIIDPNALFEDIASNITACISRRHAQDTATGQTGDNNRPTPDINV